MDDLEGIILSEISQTEKGKYFMTSLIWNLKQTSEYNKKKQTHRYRELVVISGEKEVWRGNIGVGN